MRLLLCRDEAILQYWYECEGGVNVASTWGYWSKQSICGADGHPTDGDGDRRNRCIQATEQWSQSQTTQRAVIGQCLSAISAVMIRGMLMTDEVVLISGQIETAALHAELERILSAEDGVAFQIRPHPRRVRGIEPSVLVAILGAAGTSLAALIRGVLKLATERGSRTIRLVGRSGAEIEVPANTPPALLMKYAEIAQTLDLAQIHID